MDIGIPLELSDEERRVALSPAGTHRIVQAGHRVFVQRGAGDASHYHDDEYQDAGAHLVYSGEEAFGRADAILERALAAMEPVLRLINAEEGDLARVRPDSLGPLRVLPVPRKPPDAEQLVPVRVAVTQLDL